MNTPRKPESYGLTEYGDDIITNTFGNPEDWSQDPKHVRRRKLAGAAIGIGVGAAGAAIAFNAWTNPADTSLDQKGPMQLPTASHEYVTPIPSTSLIYETGTFVLPPNSEK